MSYVVCFVAPKERYLVTFVPVFPLLSVRCKQVLKPVYSG